MKIIDLIEKYCNCRVLKITAEYRGGTQILYKSDDSGIKKSFSFSFQEGSVRGNIFYSAPSEIDEDKRTLMSELAACLVENNEYWNLSDSLSQVAEIGTENVRLEDVIAQTLNTIIYSHFFDRSAVMFFNDKLMELRGIRVAGVPPYDDEHMELFKKVRIPVQKEQLKSIATSKNASTIIGNKISAQLGDKELKNNLIISPIGTNDKIYGVLVLYSDHPYDDRHFSAAKSTARFVTAMISAVIVYNKYKYSLVSEKQLTEQIKNNEALLTLGNYAATIAHEIKNPLISIGGFAKRIMKAVNDPDLKKMAKIISTESERLERLTEDILSYAKKHEPIKTSVNLYEEIENIKMLFEGRIKESNITLNVNINPKLIISVDKNQFRQVVVNLIANAMNAVENDGEVTISCNEYESFDNLVIADTGSGIPEDNLAKLFKPFFTTSKNGTGLGLAISKKIMINHGGDIVAKNGAKGAEFTLIIPK